MAVGDCGHSPVVASSVLVRQEVRSSAESEEAGSRKRKGVK